MRSQLRRSVNWIVVPVCLLLPYLSHAGEESPNDVTVTVNTATVLNTMRGGIGASWHAIEEPIPHSETPDPLFGLKSHGGSGWGAYPPADDDGARFLVDRLWPRGLKREALKLDEWLKEAAPSDSLRRWFGHDPKKWEEFRRRYFEELDRRPDAWRPILESARNGAVTLLYSAKETRQNNAVALKEYLESKRKEV